MQRWVEAGKLWAPAATFMLEFGLCVSLTWATMIQLWSLVSGFAMRIVKPSGVLNCNQFGAKLLSKDAIDRLWSFVFLPCIYIILFLSYLFYYIIYDILCYVRLYAVYTVCPGLVSCPFIDNDLKVCSCGPKIDHTCIILSFTASENLGVSKSPENARLWRGFRARQRLQGSKYRTRCRKTNLSMRGFPRAFHQMRVRLYSCVFALPTCKYVLYCFIFYIINTSESMAENTQMWVRKCFSKQSS